jgi:hypothetical protein
MASEKTFHDSFGADTSVLQPEEEAPPPFRFLIPVREYSCVGLGTSPEEKRDERAYAVPFQLSGQVLSVARPCSGKTLLVDNAPCPACWTRTGHLSTAPDASDSEAKAACRLRYGSRCGRVQMQASDF